MQCLKCVRNTVDHAVFRLDKDGETAILAVSTDDILCATSNSDIFWLIHSVLKETFEITMQEGPVLSYLNLRIIQSELGISLDQTEHINDLVKEWYPDGFKPTHTQLRTERKFKTDIAQSLPPTTQ